MISTCEPEAPTRILKQFMRLFKALKSLDESYSDEKALEVLREVRDSSCNIDRVKVLRVLASEPENEFSVSAISQELRLGKSSVNRHLNALWNLKLVNRTYFESNYKEVIKWKFNEKNEVSKTFLMELQPAVEVIK